MSKKYPGGIINKTPPTPSGPLETDTAPGVWTLEQQAYWKKQGQWPTAGNVPPAYVEDVFSTYLYTGTGTGQTINNGIALVANYGGSAKFDGTGDYLTVASNAAFGYGTGNFTFEAWINPSVAHSGYVLDHGTTGNTGTIELAPDGKIIYYNSTSGAIQTAPGYAPLGSWTHVAVVRSSGTTTIYINGRSRASGADSYNYPDQRVVIGAISSNFLYSFNGYISNLRIVKGTAVYTAAFTPPTAPLTAISGTSLLTGQAPTPLIDNSANAFPITVVNATADVSYGPFIDTANSKGGLVWFKNRSVADDNVLFNTVSGPTKMQRLLTDAQETIDQSIFRTFNSNGFTHGGWGGVGGNGNGIASWTFRKQPKFFDIVTYTGDGSGTGKTINHNLASTPGFLIVKRTDLGGPWICLAVNGIAGSRRLILNLSNAGTSELNDFGDGSQYIPPNSNNFTVTNNLNISNATYVAYLYAHNAGGFGLTGTDNLISCGSFTTDGSGNATVSLGYEPQWVLRKSSSEAFPWYIMDNMRGYPTLGSSTSYLSPNNSNAEAFASVNDGITSTGFKIQGQPSGVTYIYIAIRRGPMRTPTTGTSVFSPVTFSFDSFTTAGFPVDFLLSKQYTGVNSMRVLDRLRGCPAPPSLFPDLTNPESQEGYWKIDNSIGVNNIAGGTIPGYENWMFRRAPGFFDVVCYTGDGTTNRAVTHNLTVAPELIIVKARIASGYWWMVYSAALGPGKYLALQATFASGTNNAFPLAQTATNFYVSASGSDVNVSSVAFVAYLFATCPGVSKVGSYTGNGTSLTIPCGFTAGARFVMIKRTDNTGDWYVWDTARGIVSGNDPHLSLNTNVADVTTDDTIDPDNSGFIINQVAATNVNVTGGTYIFLAIA